MKNFALLLLERVFVVISDGHRYDKSFRPVFKVLLNPLFNISRVFLIDCPTLDRNLIYVSWVYEGRRSLIVVRVVSYGIIFFVNEYKLPKDGTVTTIGVLIIQTGKNDLLIKLILKHVDHYRAWNFILVINDKLRWALATCPVTSDWNIDESTVWNLDYDFLHSDTFLSWNQFSDHL